MLLPDHRRDWPLWARLLHTLIRIYTRGFHRLRADASPVPASGPAILAANHRSGPDPLFLIASNPRLISFLIAREYYAIRWLRPLFERVGAVPVDRGRPTAGSLRGMLDRLAAGRVAGIFPEGAIQPAGAEVQARRGVALLALESGAPVIPAQISGIHQLGGNDLWTFLRPRRVRLRYGAPVPLDDLRQRYGTEADRAVLQEAADRILTAIHTLGEEPKAP